MSNDNTIMHDPDNILEVSHLKKYFPIKGGFFGGVTGNVKAVDDVSFSIKRGTTMGLVGESGCGKSTTGRTILRLIEKTEGTILFNGEDVSDVDKKKLRELRTKMQIIFQDPSASLDPRMTVGEIIGEAIDIHKLAQSKKDYEAGLADYEKQKADAYAQLDAQKAQIDAAAGTPYYDQALAQYQEAKIQVAAQLEEASKKLTAAKTKIDAGEDKLNDGYAKLEKGRKELETSKKKLSDGRSKLADGKKKLADAEEEIEDARKKVDDIENPKTYVLGRDTNIGYVCFDNDTSIVDSIARVFPVFFFLVAALVCMTTMTRMIDEQRTQIGTLKALGYSDGTIAWKYMSYSGGAALLGCALGFGGVLVATLGNHGGGSVKGMAFMLIASVIFALAGPWNKAVTQHADSFSISVLNLGVGGLALAVLGFAMGGSLHPQSAAGIPVLLFLAFISGAGYVIWALLMKNNPVSRIAVFGLIIPIMNVLLSALLNGEPLFEWNYLAALVLVCIGIFMVNRAPQTQETKA